MQRVAANVDIFSLENTSDQLMSEKYGKLSKQHFYNRTSLPVTRFDDDIEEDDGDDYKLPYSIPYRRMYSMHYYQAPELLIPTTNTTAKYVKPTIKSDIYGIGLMLWELINRVVPYVIYNHDELIKGLIKGHVQLPVLDKSSILFKEIFEKCLHVDCNKRLSDVTKLITLIEDSQLLGYSDKDNIEVLEINEPKHERSNEKKAEKNIKNSDQRDKLREKIYFSKTENDPQKRFENALTTESLINLGIRDTSNKISDSIHSSEMEPHLVSFSQQPGILQEDALDRIRRTVESQRDITPKKPSRKKDEEHLEISKNSTMFQSFFGFDRLQTPKVDKDVIYERTSTLKKRMKASGSSKQKKSVKGLFDDKVEKFGSGMSDFEVVSNNNDFDVKIDSNKMHDASDEKRILRDQFEKMNEELNLIINNYNKNDFMQEIVDEIKEREKTKKDNNGVLVSSFLNKSTQDHNNLSRSFEELPVNDKEAEFAGIKRSESDAFGSNLNRFSSHESFSLPHTPIARLNMIRRNAWLSDNNRNAAGSYISDDIARRSLNFIKNSPISDYQIQKSTQQSQLPQQSQQQQNNTKQYNVNIKIHHNDLESTTLSTPKSTNLNQSSQLMNSSVKIKLYNSASKITPIVKINNVDLNKTSYTEDINKKYYPLMPEMLSDAIQNKRSDRSMSVLQTSHFEDEHNKINNEKKLQNIHPQKLSIDDDSYDSDDDGDEIEEKVIIPLPMSVRETVKLIETTFNPKTDVSKSHEAASHHNEKIGKISEETQTDERDYFPLETIKDVEENEEDVAVTVDKGKECVDEASDAIQKLENSKLTPAQPIKRVETVAHQSSTTPLSTKTPKKTTTKVMLNFKQITGRSSDVTHLKRVQEQVRNNPEILKQLQTHLKESSLAACKNEISASCSSLIAKECTSDEVAVHSKKGHKYFCRNCGFTMIPAEILQKSKLNFLKLTCFTSNISKFFLRFLVQTSGRLSIASSIADSLHAIKYDESLQSLAAIRKCQQSTVSISLNLSDFFF